MPHLRPEIGGPCPISGQAGRLPALQCPVRGLRSQLGRLSAASLQPFAAGTGRTTAPNRRRVEHRHAATSVLTRRRCPVAAEVGSSYVQRDQRSPGLRRTAGTFFRRSSGSLIRTPGIRKPGQREAHRHAVVVVGVDRRPAAAGRGSNRQAVVALVDLAPSLRSSVATAAMRSVSLWRMWPTLRIVVGPSANSATTASVCTVSLIAFMSTSMPRSGRPITVIDVRIAPHFAAHLFQALDERDVALQAVGR